MTRLRGKGPRNRGTGKTVFSSPKSSTHFPLPTLYCTMTEGRSKARTALRTEWKVFTLNITMCPILKQHRKQDERRGHVKVTCRRLHSLFQDYRRSSAVQTYVHSLRLQVPYSFEYWFTYLVLSLQLKSGP
jgi:hypothetical protein